MTQACFAIPGDIDLPTGGYAYDRRMLGLLPANGVRAEHVVLPGSFPDPSAADLAETQARLAACPEHAVLLIDGLAYGALPADLIRRLGRKIVALVHHPLCMEAGLSCARQAELHALEKAALALATRIVVTSPATAKTLVADFAVADDRITIAEPGTDPAPRARGTGRPVRLLAIGSVVPRKAYDVLVQALVPLTAQDWRLDIVGALDRSAETAAALQRAIAASKLGDRISVRGPASSKAVDAYYDAADVFVMSSLFEGYGMVIAEAMARGLPIVCTTGGAAADTAPDAAALKVAPGDAIALGNAIGRLLADETLRRRLAKASWRAGQNLPRWQQTAERVAEAVKRASA